MDKQQQTTKATKATGTVQAAANRAGKNSQAIADNRTAKALQKKANHTGLPDNLKSGIENLSGMSMDHVQVHYNSAQPAQLNAHAYAQGSQIHIAPGQEKHLPHEAWHVVQQAHGRVRPTMQLRGKVNVNDDSGLEKEADIMGGKALQQKADSAAQSANAHTGHKGCGCPACTGAAQLMPAEQPSSLQAAAKTGGIVQRCPKCMDPSCKKGEICGMDDDLDGLFESGIKGDKVKFYNQKEGHGGKPSEWEHPLPKAAMKKTGYSGLYSSSPVVQMPKPVHRGGVDGGGGGVSSTGYSYVSQGWAEELSSSIKSKGLAEGIRKGLTDDVNSYYAKGLLNEGHKSTFIQLIRGYVQQGAITQGEGDLIGAQVLQHIENCLRWK